MKTKTSVVAILINNDKVLMMNRKNPPLVWCPPSGRVHIGETLKEALYREVFEETGLTCDIYKQVSKWKGKHEGIFIISYIFLCKTNDNKVTLSDEHSEYKWINISDLSKWKDLTDINIEEWANIIRNEFKL